MGDGTTGSEKYRVSVVSISEPMKLANRRMVSETSRRRRPKSRTYCSTSTESLAKPCRGTSRALMSSVNRAGSRGLAPYTAVLDFITSFFRAGALWHAANSWSDPMTLISFISLRPPTRVGVEMIERWTRVSTSAVWMILAIRGLRMSAWTNSVRSRSTSGSSRSTPTMYSTSGSASSRWASFPARWRETPVIMTRCPMEL